MDRMHGDSFQVFKKILGLYQRTGLESHIDINEDASLPSQLVCPGFHTKVSILCWNLCV